MKSQTREFETANQRSLQRRRRCRTHQQELVADTRARNDGRNQSPVVGAPQMSRQPINQRGLRCSNQPSSNSTCAWYGEARRAPRLQSLRRSAVRLRRPCPKRHGLQAFAGRPSLLSQLTPRALVAVFQRSLNAATMRWFCCGDSASSTSSPSARRKNSPTSHPSSADWSFPMAAACLAGSASKCSDHHCFRTPSGYGQCGPTRAVSIHPVARAHDEVRVRLLFLVTSSGRLFPRQRGCVAAPAMVKLVDHLRFVKRPCRPFVALRRTVAEQLAVLGHVEHTQKPDAPWVCRRKHLASGIPRRLFDKHWYTPIELLGQLGITCAAKNRASTSVGVIRAKSSDVSEKRRLRS